MYDMYFSKKSESTHDIYIKYIKSNGTKKWNSRHTTVQLKYYKYNIFPHPQFVLVLFYNVWQLQPLRSYKKKQELINNATDHQWCDYCCYGFELCRDTINSQSWKIRLRPEVYNGKVLDAFCSHWYKKAIIWELESGILEFLFITTKK